MTERLSELIPNGRIIGADASQGMISAAKKLEKENLSFILLDINKMDFNGEFDVIYSNAALHWVKDHAKLLKNSLKALKPDGIIKWNFAGEGTGANFNDTLKSLMKSEEYKEFFTDFEWPWFMPSKAGYEELAAGAGFESVEIIYEIADRVFADADEMIRWMDQPCLVPFLARIPDEKKAEFRNKAIDIMKSKTMRPDGGCFETFRRINVKAVK